MLLVKFLNSLAFVYSLVCKGVRLCCFGIKFFGRNAVLTAEHSNVA